MTKFNYLSDICGSDKAFCARIRLIDNVDVDKGDLVYYDGERFGVTPEKGELTVRAGVCAERYRAEASELVPTDGSGMISVRISSDALYRTEPVTFTAVYNMTKEGICTNIKADALTDISGIVGAKLVLVHKEKDSEAAVSVGSVHTITDVQLDEGAVTFITDTGMKGSAGDVYAFVPLYGFELLELDDNGVLSLQFAGKGSFTVVEADEKAYVLRIHDIK